MSPVQAQAATDATVATVGGGWSVEASSAIDGTECRVVRAVVWYKHYRRRGSGWGGMECGCCYAAMLLVQYYYYGTALN